MLILSFLANDGPRTELHRPCPSQQLCWKLHPAQNGNSSEFDWFGQFSILQDCVRIFATLHQLLGCPCQVHSDTWSYNNNLVILLCYNLAFPACTNQQMNLSNSTIRAAALGDSRAQTQTQQNSQLFKVEITSVLAYENPACASEKTSIAGSLVLHDWGMPRKQVMHTTLIAQTHTYSMKE